MTKPKPKPTNRTTASNRRRPNVATRSKSSWRPSWPLNFNSRQALMVVGLLVVVGFIIFLARAGASQWEVENWTKSGNVPTVADSSAAGGSYINFAPTVTPAPGTVGTFSSQCDAINNAKAGMTVILNGPLQCTSHYLAPNVTLTGNYQGYLILSRPDGWKIKNLHGSVGSGLAVLQIVGGNGWTIEDSSFTTKGGPGAYGALDIGESSDLGNPTNWKVLRTTLEAPSVNPEHEGNQNLALYVIGQSGKAMNGLIESSTLIGGPGGPAVKLGGTGKTSLASDATDNVTMRNNTIIGQANADNGCAIKIVTASSNLVFDSNDIDCSGGGVPITLGTYFGTGTTFVNNRIVYKKDYQLKDYWMTGTDRFSNFVSYRWPNCPAVDWEHYAGATLGCAGNTYTPK